jgi:molybdenum cofactor cytidylyltransferase
VLIGKFDETLPGTENRMRPDREAFASAGVPLLEKLASSEDDWVSIDEIGYLETACPAYCTAIERLFDERCVAAVVRKQSLPFLQSLCGREDVFLIDLDKPFGNISCVIMASGLGTRFGGNKLTADFHGEPMILRAFKATEGIFEKRIVVTRHADVEALCRRHGIDCILHDLLAGLPGCRQLLGILLLHRSCLRLSLVCLGIDVINLLLTVLNDLHHRLEQKFLQNKKQRNKIAQGKQGCKEVNI